MSLTEIKPVRKKPIRTPHTEEPDYPTGDGKPMAETLEHRLAMTYAIDAAEIALAHVPHWWINGNDFLYYQQGNPKKRVSPDCYVVLDVPRRARPFFKVWEEGGRTPNLIIEFTSRDTAREDRETKFDLYQNVLKVKEYFLFDPLNQYLRPRFQGYRLVNGVYIPILPDSDGRLLSEETGIRFFSEGILLRFIHPLTGEVILTRQEAEAKRLEEEARRNQAEATAHAERQRAEEERQRADKLAAHLRELGISPDEL